MSGGLHGGVTVVLSSIVALLGLAMIVTAIAGGGGPTSRGVLIGVLFLLAGSGRVWLTRRGLPEPADDDRRDHDG
jgi:hypothetical protein